MKIGFAIVVATFVSVAFGQTRANQSRVDYIHFLGEQTPNIKILADLMDAIDDKDPDVRLEALRVWQLVGKEYCWFDPPRDTRQNWLRQLFAKIEPKPSDSNIVTRQSLRALCSMGRTADSICPPIIRCGLGMENTPSYQAECRLVGLAKFHASTLIELLADKDPNIVLNAWRSLEVDQRKDQLPRAISFVNDTNRLFKAIGAAMLTQNWPEKSAELLWPMLDDPDVKVRRTADFDIRVSISDRQAVEISTNNICSLNLRRLAISHLGHARNGSNDKLLIQLMDAVEPEIRLGAIGAYFLYDNKRNSALLSKFQSDPSIVVREYAQRIQARSQKTGG